jgi:hypothetical protein
MVLLYVVTVASDQRQRPLPPAKIIGQICSGLIGSGYIDAESADQSLCLLIRDRRTAQVLAVPDVSGSVDADRHGGSPLPTTRSDYDHEILEELAYVRREAQAEADLAYDAWRRDPVADAYFVYRAAQDRADAAQDALAEFAQRTRIEELDSSAAAVYWQPPSRWVVSSVRPSANQAVP